MAMYYPQDTILEMGPTAIRKGTQYCCYSNDYVPDRLVYDPNQTKYREVNLTCRAGTIVVLNFEIDHRRVKNTLTDRFMIKYQFRRRNPPVSIPTCPSYEEVPTIDTNYDQEFIDPKASIIWDYLRGITKPARLEFDEITISE